jgi:membrane protein DedA with SNARE-associated domain
MKSKQIIRLLECVVLLIASSFLVQYGTDYLRLTFATGTFQCLVISAVMYYSGYRCLRHACKAAIKGLISEHDGKEREQ